MKAFSIMVAIFIFVSLTATVFAGDFNAKLQMFNGGLFNVNSNFDFDDELDRLEKIANDLPVNLREQAELFLTSDALKGFIATTSEEIQAIVEKGITCAGVEIESKTNRTLISKNPFGKKCIKETGEVCGALTPAFLCPGVNIAQSVKAELCELKIFITRNSGNSQFLVTVSNKSEALSKSGRALYLCGTVQNEKLAANSLEATWLRESLEYLNSELKSTCTELHSCFLAILSHAKDIAFSICDKDVQTRIGEEHSKLDLVSKDDVDGIITGIMRAYLTIKAVESHVTLIEKKNALYLNMMKHSCAKADVLSKGRISVVGFNSNNVTSQIIFAELEKYFSTASSKSCLSSNVMEFARGRLKFCVNRKTHG